MGLIVGIIVLPSVGELEMEMEIELELELAIIVVRIVGIKPPIGGEMELRPPPRCIKRTLDVIF